MNWHGDRRAIPSLVVSVAVLLLTAGWAAIAVSGGDGSATTITAGGRQVGATGLGQAALLHEEAPAGSSTVTVGPLTVPTTAPAPGGPITTTTPTGVVLPPMPPLPLPTRTIARGPETTVFPPPPVPGPTTTLLPAPRTNSWSRSTNGVTVRMRMEPAAPVAGQPVTFFVDNVSAPLPCCVVHMSFGDGTDMPVGSSNCENPTLRAGMVATHTYAAPGAYEILLVVVTFPCRPATGDGPVQPTITGTDIRACIAVGPGTAPDRCTPVEHFRPSAG